MDYSPIITVGPSYSTSVGPKNLSQPHLDDERAIRARAMRAPSSEPGGAAARRPNGRVAMKFPGRTLHGEKKKHLEKMGLP